MSHITNPVGIGGVIAGGTPGSVLFIGAGGVLAQDNAAFNWNDSTDTLTLTGGTNGNLLTVTSANTSSTNFNVNNTSTGGHHFQIFATGSANTPGWFGVFDSDAELGGGATIFAVDGNTSNVQIPKDSSYGFSNTIAFAGTNTYDVNIYSQGKGTVDIWQRSSLTSPCALRVYNTNPSGVGYANWERFTIDWITSTNVCRIGTEFTGGGSSRPLQFIVGGTAEMDFGVTNTGQWTITSLAVGGNTPGLTISQGSGSAGAYLNLVGWNAGTPTTATVFADFSGVLNLSSANGVIQINTANTTASAINLNNTSAGGKLYQFASGGSAYGHGAGVLEIQDQSGAMLQHWFYNGTNTILNFNSTTIFGFGSDVFGNSPDVAFYRNSAGTFEINSTTIGTFRDLILRDLYTNDATFFHRSKTTLTNNAAGNVGTLANAPTAGNPTKWIGIDDNGTTRFVPAW